MTRDIGTAILLLPAALFGAAGAGETVPLSSHGAPAITSIAVNQSRVPRYEKFEITVGLTGTWSNPFDPQQVALDGLFVTADGSTKTVPGFYFQDYSRRHSDGREELIRVGEPVWKVRFSPVTAGTHRFKLRLTNQGRTIESEWRTFECTANSNKPGFARVSRDNPYYFQFENGAPFFVIGENIALLGAMGTAQADKLYCSLARVGGNFARMWWCAGGTDLESRLSDRPDHGLGRYKLDEAWRIDYVVNLAEQLGVYLMACLETQQYLRRGVWWERFTYNVANGGPVTSPADFFVNEKAGQLFKRRLRYIVGRWSYSTAIFSWQFWNEVSAANDFNEANVARWHERMARYLRSIDPNPHLIHTNFGNLDGHAGIDGLPEMEVLSTNIYSRRDMGETAAWGTRMMTARYRKPFLLTEYGVGHYGERRWAAEDPKGIIVHNGLWGALVSGSAGAALPWGWASWVDPQNLYHYWKVVADVVRDVPFHKRQWRNIKVARLAFKEPGREPYYAPAFFEGWPRNYSFTLAPRLKPQKFTITPEGEADRPESLDARLGAGDSHTFSVELPVDTDFVVHVPEISSGRGGGYPILRVLVDGQERYRRELTPVSKDYPWEYWQEFRLPLKAGRRTLEIANAGSGGLWTAYELKKYVRREGPDLEVRGLQTQDQMLLWVRNPEFIWIYDREGRTPAERPEGLLTLADLRPGPYLATWWDTTTGEVLDRRALRSDGDRLTIPIPKISRSAAAKLLHLHD